MERKWWTLTAVSAGMLMLLLDITIVNVALPDIQRQLGGSLSDLQWVIDAYALSLAALLLTAGIVALAGARLAFALIRQRDFVEAPAGAEGELVPAAA